MADYDIPDDLLQLKVDYLASEAECFEIGKWIPSNVAVLNGEAERMLEQEGKLAAEQAKRLDLVMQLHRHPWWKTVDNPFKASMALNEAAKQALAAAKSQA